MRIVNIVNFFLIKEIVPKPTRIEQDIAYQYVCLRELERPKTNYFKFSVKIFSLLLVGFLLSHLLHSSIENYSAFMFLPEVLISFYYFDPFGFKICFIFIFEFIILILFSRLIIIEIIRLYQRYADQEIRRRCLFKPTCSEYTIMSLNKYGVIFGLYLSYNRIFKKCCGNVYRIDYP